MTKRIKLYGEQQNIVEQFPCLHAWGVLCGSNDHFIVCECIEAKRQGAPSSVVYRTDTKWITLDQVKNEETRTWFRRNYPTLVDRFVTSW